MSWGRIVLDPRAVLCCVNVGVFLGRIEWFVSLGTVNSSWIPPGQQLIFLTPLIWMLCDDLKTSLCGDFFPWFFCFFSLPCVHLFLSKDEPLYIVHKSPTCVSSEHEEMWLNKEKGKLVASSTSSPQGRKLTFDKITALLKSPSKNRCRFHRGLIF